LIDRIESRLVEEFGLESYDYSEYITEVRSRLAHVKSYLLTDKQREFYHHVMTEYDNRTQWYQSICYTILEQRLDTLKDEQEDKLVDDLVYLFRECEKYADISQKVSDSEKNEAYSFDMVTNKGTNVRTQTYVLPEKDKHKAEDLEKKISKLLSGDTNIDVCTLLSILNKKMKK
jgi:DNA-binding PadR family transcriptional regulator